MKGIICIFLFLFSFQTKAQYGIVALTGGYTYQFPFGDLGDNYTNNSNISAGLTYKLKSNWIFGLEGQFLFGSDVSNRFALGSMINSNGFIIGDNTSLVVPEMEGRGGNIFAEVGKIFPTSEENKNSGIALKLGLGYFYYHTSITTDEIVPQLLEDYYAGYTRAQGGLSFVPYVGYIFYGKKKMFNAQIGIQGVYSQSNYLNKWDFVNNQSLENETNSNILIGPKVGMAVILKTFQKLITDNDGYFYN